MPDDAQMLAFSITFPFCILLRPVRTKRNSPASGLIVLGHVLQCCLGQADNGL